MTSHGSHPKLQRSGNERPRSQGLVMNALHDEATPAERARVVAGRHATGLEITLLTIWAAPYLLITAGRFYRSTMWFQTSYNEGWNASFAALFFHGQPLYYPSSALITNNYPPLSFILVSWMMHIIPDAIFAGRALAAAALIGIVSLIMLILWAIVRDGLAAFAGGMIFFSYMAISGDGGVGVDDPQVLCISVLLLGLYIKVRLGARPAADIVSALVMVAGLFIKHNYIALPLALGVWLLIFDRKAGLRFIATGIGAGLCGLLAAWVAFGPMFFSSLLAPRYWSLGLGARQVLAWLGPINPLLILAAIPIALYPRDRMILLFGGYAIAAILVGCLVALGEGTSQSAMYEVVIAASLAIGVLLARLGHPPMLRCAYLRVWIIVAAALSTALAPGLYGAKDVLLLPSWLALQRQRESESLKAVRFIAAQPGPVLCSTPALCYWAGKSFDLDSFNFGEAVEMRRRPLSDLTDRILSGYYSTIELFVSKDDPSVPASSVTNIGPAIRAAVARLYREVPVNNGPSSFWVRKASGTAE